VLFNLDRSNRAAWRVMTDADSGVLAPRSFYRSSDYLFALRIGFEQARMSLGALTLAGKDVTGLFEADRHRFAFDGGALEAILSYRLPMRLAEAGYGPDLFIEPFENMIPEKSLILGFRRYLPRTRLVGYQHSTVPPMLLCNFVTAGESRIAPLPDRVVCSGKLFRDVLVANGLPSELAVVGPALRFAHLWSRPPRTDHDPDDAGAVLVALPLTLDAAVELLWQVLDALGPSDDVQVLVKPHPMVAMEQVLSAGRVQQLPEHFHVVTGSMEDALRRSYAVVSFGSSALYEAVAAGVPILVVARESGLDLNPLVWHKDLDDVCRTPAAIREGLIRARDLGAVERERYRDRAERLRGDFGEVNDETMSAFVDGLIDPPTRR
jgi:surface carbohydrate biosynthesis protein (TIGR04326 family)